MSDVVIRAEGLSKRYLIGHETERESYIALRDVIARSARKFARSAGDMLRGRQLLTGNEIEEFWALKDVNFEVKRGEVVGIIGRNGAGKSTLLKILSRITEPTTGRVQIRGRVASLLEVGTGFHPELTGRENIFLNGAILGMSRVEIKRRFDEIVAFAEVEKFLDTPVKRYSSGMYVRLAFAVAAHLEPEILIVDEVLAVGDAEFQKKCLGKMKDVAGHGRTVLFVSHSQPAIRSLCSRGMLLSAGAVVYAGPVDDVFHQYNSSARAQSHITWGANEGPGNEEVRLRALQVRQEGEPNVFNSSLPTRIVMEVDCAVVPEGLNIGFELSYDNGVSLFWSHYTDDSEDRWPDIALGRNRLECQLPPGWLNAGRYFIAPKLSVHNIRWIANSPPQISFDVVLGHSLSPYWTSLSNGKRQGLLAPVLSWQNITPQGH